MDHENIQNLLDKCLLKDEEIKLGPKMWEEALCHSDDKIRLPTKL